MPLFDILDGFLNPISYLVFQWSEIGTWEEKKEKNCSKFPKHLIYEELNPERLNMELYNFYLFFIEGQLPYIPVLVSATHQQESSMTYVPCPLSLPLTSHPIPLGRHSTGVTSWVKQQIPLAICFTHADIHVSTLLSPFVPLPVSTSLSSLSVFPLLPYK